jgi:hypothetical protein
MAASAEYTGTHKVVLPPDFLNSIDVAVELYEDDIAAVAANLNVSGLKTTVSRAVTRVVSAGFIIWLLPVGWSTCI